MNDAKVDDYDGPRVQYKDVTGLDVPVDDSLAVSGLKAVCRGDNDVDYSFNGNRLVTVQILMQRFAPQKRHDEVRKFDVAVPKFAAIGYCNNVRMLQVRQN